MARFDTDTELSFTFSLVFYAATSGDADTIAKNLITKVFGSACAALMDLTSTSSVALSGQDISGANYTYNYALDFRLGDMDASPSPIYNTVFASTAADALAAVQANAQRMTAITNMPLKINYLKAAT